MSAPYQYGESEPLRGEALSDKLDVQVRHGFIRKVFGIVFTQLLVTTVIAAPFSLHNAAARMFIANNSALIFVASFMPLIMLCYAMCNPSVVRDYPKNYIFLALITLVFGLLVGVITAQYTAESVVLAAGITCFVTFGLMLFAFQTKYDFTGMGPYLYTFLLIMVGMSFIMMFLPYSRGVEVVYSSLGACLFSFYIVYDTQLIVGGKHSSHRFAIDEYAFAALNLYLDIIQLFLHILRIMGERR